MAKRGPESAVDATGMRRSNAELLLRMIWREGAISRAELARRSGMSPSTVSDIVSELQDRDLVAERGTGASRGGRRPTMLGLDEDHFQLIGIELGAVHIAVVVTTLRGTPVLARQVGSATRDDPVSTLERTHALIESCLSHSAVRRRKVVGIGVAVPCPVDPARPGRLSRLVLPKWAEIDLRDELASRYRLPVFVENDANAGALAEQWWGGHANGGDLTFIKIATGIGAGYIIDGHLYRGAGGTAGEIGHLSIDQDGPECPCGLRGCLTTFVGTEALLERARAAIPALSNDELGLETFVSAAIDGDRGALAIVDDVGHYLGVGVAGLLNLMNPSVVVLGGGITRLGDLLIDPLRRSVRSQALFSSVARTQIVNSRLGENAIAIGSTALVLAAAFNDLALFSKQVESGA